MLIIGSPPCTCFSRLQELNKHMYKNNEQWMAKFAEGMEQAKRYVRCCVKIYNHQIANGRYFLHEHPWLATSWMLPEMQKLESNPEVLKVRTDMCQFDMMSRTGGIGSPLGHVLKPIGFTTDCKHIATELGRICPRDHAHVPFVGGRAAAAAIYPEKLCRAICRGLSAQLRADRGLLICSPDLDARGLKSLSLLCCEASGLKSQGMDHQNGIASHVWGRQDSSDKATPIDRVRGKEMNDDPVGRVRHEANLEQQEWYVNEVANSSQEVSVGECVMRPRR